MLTKDIGILIRDRIEGDSACAHDWDGPSVEVITEHEIDFVDVSDASNPIIHVSNGQKFIIRIIAA